MHASVHACKQGHAPHASVHGEVESEQAEMCRETAMGELGESSKHKPRKTPVVLFSRRGRGRDALGCSVMHALSNYLQPYQEQA